MTSRRSLLLGAIVSCLPLSACAAEAPTGPTPYPTRDEDWPGVGEIRLFDYMPEHRNAYWQERTAKQGSVVFTGDSLTEFWETLEDDFKTLRIANRAIGGEVSRGLLFRFKEDVLDLKPRAIVMLIGNNDLTASQPATQSIANIRSMLAQWRAQAPSAPLLLCTVPPSADPSAPIDAEQRNLLNAAVRKLPAEYPGLYVVDLFAALADERGMPVARLFEPDRLHFSRAGYAKWKEVLTPVMKQAGVL